MDGRMEYGPRSLVGALDPGRPARSPRYAEAAQSQDQVPAKASARSRPAVLREKAAEWFELDRRFPPTCLFVAGVRPERVAAR